jgi:hypothetical protein
MMRSAVHGQADAKGHTFVSRQEQPVAAEIVKADAVKSDPVKQCANSRIGEDLTGKDMVSLEAGAVPCRAGRVDRPERKHWAAGPHNG